MIFLLLINIDSDLIKIVVIYILGFMYFFIFFVYIGIMDSFKDRKR